MQKYYFTFISLAALLFVIGAGCRDTGVSTTTTSTVESRLELPNNDQEWEAYKVQAKNQIDKFTLDISALQTSTLRLGTSTRAQYAEALDDLKERQAAAEAEYENLKNSTAQTWMNIKTRLDLSLQALGESYSDLKLRIDASGSAEANPTP